MMGWWRGVRDLWYEVVVFEGGGVALFWEGVVFYQVRGATSLGLSICILASSFSLVLRPFYSYSQAIGYRAFGRCATQ